MSQHVADLNIITTSKLLLLVTLIRWCWVLLLILLTGHHNTAGCCCCCCCWLTGVNDQYAHNTPGLKLFDLTFGLMSKTQEPSSTVLQTNFTNWLVLSECCLLLQLFSHNNPLVIWTLVSTSFSRVSQDLTDVVLAQVFVSSLQCSLSAQCIMCRCHNDLIPSSPAQCVPRLSTTPPSHSSHSSQYLGHRTELSSL